MVVEGGILTGFYKLCGDTLEKYYQKTDNDWPLPDFDDSPVELGEIDVHTCTQTTHADSARIVWDGVYSWMTLSSKFKLIKEN